MAIRYPLHVNLIRARKRNNAYGMVRNGGSRAHQGWDLQAMPLTPCFAIADGRVVDVITHSDYGLTLTLRFTDRGQTLYASYCHLSSTVAQRGEEVRIGDPICYTGYSGNAESLAAAEQHLHFEIRTQLALSHGLSNHVDPSTLYAITPLQVAYVDNRYLNESDRPHVAPLPPGLKLPGINVLQ